MKAAMIASSGSPRFRSCSTSSSSIQLNIAGDIGAPSSFMASPRPLSGTVSPGILAFVQIGAFASQLALAISTTSASADVVTYNASLAAPNTGIPGVYFGTGNANTNFTVNTLTDGIEIGLSAIQRYVGPIVPSTNVYQAPHGASTSPLMLGLVETAVV